MRDNQTLIDDILKLGGNVFGNILGARHELKAQGKQRLEFLTRHLDLISRAEFDAAFAMLAKARLMQEELNERIESIEAHLGLTSTRKPKKKAKVNLPSLKKPARSKKRA